MRARTLNRPLTRELDGLHEVVEQELGKDTEAVVMFQEGERRFGGSGRRRGPQGCVLTHMPQQDGIYLPHTQWTNTYKNVLERNKDARRRHDGDAGLGRGPVQELPGQEVRRLV